jgi:hypothetical protein
MPLLTLRSVDSDALVGVLPSGMKAGWRARDWDGSKVLLINRRAWWTKGSNMFLFQPLGLVELYPMSSSLIVDGRVWGEPVDRGRGPWTKLWGANHRDGGGLGQ